MRKILVSAIAAAVLVVLFASSQGTAALWRAEERINPGAITTGSLSLAAGDGASMSEDFVFKDLNTSTLAPGGFVQAPLAISNTGTTALAYTLAGATSAPATQGAADVELAAAVKLSVHAGACLAGDLSPGELLAPRPSDGAAAFESARKLEATASEVLCVRVTRPRHASRRRVAGRCRRENDSGTFVAR